MKHKLSNNFFSKVNGTIILRFGIILLLLLFVVSMIVGFQHFLSGSKTNPFPLFDNGSYSIPKDLDRSYR